MQFIFRPTATFAMSGFVACAALLAAVPCQAQYKVVGPNGTITYTDRPPPAEPGKSKPVNVSAGASSAAPDVPFPYELKQAASRYPVTLYTAAGCAPCESGRRWLRERGVPYVEKTVTTQDEAAALTRVVGGLDLPAMTIGSQPVRGYQPDQWAGLFDVAGYPRTSQLPKAYNYAAAAPLIGPAASAPATPARAPDLTVPPPPAPTPENPSNIKF